MVMIDVSVKYWRARRGQNEEEDTADQTPEL